MSLCSRKETAEGHCIVQLLCRAERGAEEPEEAGYSANRRPEIARRWLTRRGKKKKTASEIFSDDTASSVHPAFIFLRSPSRPLGYRRLAVILTTIVFLVCFKSSLPIIRSAAGPQSPGPSGYHLVRKVKLGGTGGWDYLEVDPATHRLFISRGTHVLVVDPDQGKIVGDIPDTQGVHGIAIANEFNKGFTTNGRKHAATP